MGNQSPITQELVNFFPEWTKVRTDPDSNGYRLLNSVANEIEDLEQALLKVENNIHVTTFNLDEIDEIYKIQLSSSYVFKEEATYNNITSYVLPDSIIGELDSGIKFSIEDATNIYTSAANAYNSIGVGVIESGSIRDFWEASLPDSFTKIQTLSFGKTGVFHFDGDYLDSNSSGLIVTNVGTTSVFSPAVSTGGSIEFSGAGATSCIEITDGPDHDMLHWDAEFTLDFWFKLDDRDDLTSFLSSKAYHPSHPSPNEGATPGYLSIIFAGTTHPTLNNYDFYIGMGNQSGSANVFSGSSVTSGTWHHFAITRDTSGDTRFFLDGVLKLTNTNNNAGTIQPNTTDGYRIGIYTDGTTAPFDGNIDEFRIIKGKAEWTRDFILPVSQYNPLPVVKKVKELDRISGLQHPLFSVRGGGKFYFRLSAGYPYFRKGDDNSIFRARVLISGRTRKGVKDSEVIVFPWESLIPSRKEWATIDSVIPLDILDTTDSGTDSTLTIYGDNSLQEDSLSLSNLRWSKQRKKVDEFWGILKIDGKSILERAEYAVDNWRMLLKGYTGKLSKDRWHFQDQAGDDLSNIIDLELVPFKNQAWVLSSTHLFLYELNKENNINIDRFKELPTNPNIEIMLDMDDLVKSETLTFYLYHKKTLKSIESYKLWYEVPGNTTKVFFSDSGSASTAISYTENNRIVYNGTLDISNNGEYILGATVVYNDGASESTTKLVNIKHKKPLKSFLLSDLSISSPTGLFLDSDQKLWIKTDSDFHEIKLHKNIALFDYNRKVIYLHERYKSLTVNYPA